MQCPMMPQLLSSASCWASASCSMAGCVLSAPSSYNPPLLEVNLPTISKSRTFSLGVAPLPSMGGGPRTFPGGVTKWQWKRMQQKKATQILKARLLRERHVYEARRRAELMAATPELEMPWQKMSRIRPPNYVAADEHIKKLAGRFQKNGAQDLWTENDGPETFERVDGPSNASSSSTMHREVNPRATGGKFRSALSVNIQSINHTRGADSKDGSVSKSEGFTSRKFWPLSRAKRDAAHNQGSESTEDSFLPRSSVSVNASRRNVKSIRPKTGINQGGTENNWTDAGEGFFGKGSEDYSKSRREPARARWNNSMDRHTHN